MKQILLFLATILCFSAFGQVKEDSYMLNGEEKNAFSIKLPKTEKKEVEKAWDKYMKKEYDGKVKMNKKTGIIFADDAEIENMSNNTVDVSAQVMQNGDDTELTVWYNLGGAYLTSDLHEDKVEYGKDLLSDFALTVSRAAIEEMLEAEEDKLKDLRKDQKDLVEDKEDHLKDIADWEEKIKEARQKITENEQVQVQQKMEVEKQEAVVEKVRTRLKKID